MGLKAFGKDQDKQETSIVVAHNKAGDPVALRVPESPSIAGQAKQVVLNGFINFDERLHARSVADAAAKAAKPGAQLRAGIGASLISTFLPYSPSGQKVHEAGGSALNITGAMITDFVGEIAVRGARAIKNSQTKTPTK